MRLSASYSTWHTMLSINGYFIIIIIIIKFTVNVQLSFVSLTWENFSPVFKPSLTFFDLSHLTTYKISWLCQSFYKYRYFMLTVTLSQEKVWFCLHMFVEIIVFTVVTPNTYQWFRATIRITFCNTSPVASL